ncbi:MULTISPECIES: YybS family protein [Virgibacillus]|uniref:YybS family protein n=1 Tax=Virgibacillus TaxID=84406 RepID=UPI0004058E01|nr:MULTISPECIES: YybS family protein [Bacillaceae]WBX81397.1 YybS family protein [Virgibacillus salarius]
MNHSKQLTDGALLTLVFMGLLLVSLFVPIIPIVSIFLLPIPFIIYSSRYDWKPALIMFAFSIVMTILFTTIYTLPMTVLMGLGGIMIGSSIYRNLSAYETWARGTFGFIIGLLFAFVFTQFVFQINVIDAMEQIFNESMEMSTGVIEQFTAEAQLEEIDEIMQQTIHAFVTLFPFFLATIAILMAFLSQWFSYKFLNRIERKDLRFPPFRELRFPNSIIFVYVIALLFAFIFTDPESLQYMATQNLLLLTQMLVTIQGFSFLFFYANYKKITKAFPIICVVIGVLFPMMLFIIRFIGIFDLGFGLRDKLAEKD